MEVQYYYVVNVHGDVLMCSSCYMDDIGDIVDRFVGCGCEVHPMTKGQFDLIDRSSKTQEVVKMLLNYPSFYDDIPF
jgi:hypothetical protein